MNKFGIAGNVIPFITGVVVRFIQTWYLAVEAPRELKRHMEEMYTPEMEARHLPECIQCKQIVGKTRTSAVSYRKSSKFDDTLIEQGPLKEDEHEELRWNQLISFLYNTNQNFDSFWSLDKAGGIWIVSFATVAIIMLVSGWGILFEHVDNPFELTFFKTVFLCVGGLAVCLGLGLTELTQECDSIVGVATSLHANEALGGRLRFVLSAQTNQMGVRLCGVRVSRQLVVSSALKLFVGLPSLYAFIHKATLQDGHPSHSH